MNPCPQNQRLIVWLAVEALEPRQESDLRAHLETCAGCRGYLEEVSRVSATLARASIAPPIEASDGFHRRVLGALRAEQQKSAWARTNATVRWLTAHWRLLLPIGVAGCALIAVTYFHSWQPGPDRRLLATPPREPVLEAKQDLDPTLSNYQTVANESLEKLDELLARQGSRNPSSAPIYTASSVPPAGAYD